MRREATGGLGPALRRRPLARPGGRLTLRRGGTTPHPDRPARRRPRVAGTCAGVAVALVLAGCGGAEEPASTASSTTATEDPTTAALRAAGCRPATPTAPREPQRLEPAGPLRPGDPATLRLRTSCGEVVVALDVDGSPRTAGAVAGLARSGFYDGLPFHRVVPGTLVQGGDPAGDGSGDPGFDLAEAPEPDAAYPPGTVAMAKTEADPPGAVGSQFFVVAGDGLPLPPEYAIAGRVRSGLGVVRRIADLGTPGADGPPRAPVVVERATVTGG